MLHRIYVDNYACFVNFELSLGPVVLLAGRNGSGKSRLLDLITDLPGLVVGGTAVSEVFGQETTNRWEARSAQTVEVDLGESGTRYRYRLVVDQLEDGSTGIRSEALDSDGDRIFEFDGREARLYPDGGGAPSLFPAGPRSSTLSLVGDGIPEFKRVAEFKRQLSRITLVKPDPEGMEADTRRESPVLAVDMSDFPSWYRFALQADTRSNQRFVDELAEVIPGFVSLKFRSAGKMKFLVAEMSGADGVREFDIDELSSGQRVLIALYALLHFENECDTWCFDEPDNFLALAEIQPWLRRILEQVERPGRQVIIVSHHPELLDQLPITRLWRDAGGPVRAAPFQLSEDEELRPSEVIARGWDTPGHG